MERPQVLITGGDGYLGLQIAMRYLDRTDDSIVLWVRARTEQEFAAKRERAAGRLGALVDRVIFRSGELQGEQPFQTVEPAGVRAIIHAAAVTRFNVDEETARRVNVEGARKLFEFAIRCPSLQALGVLSTVYASGLKTGRIEEAPLEGVVEFTNHYERSKWAAETLLLTGYGQLPWRIFRIATALADDDTGTVTQHNAVHHTLRLLFYGLLSLMPGEPATPLYFVTGEFAADAVFELMGRPPDRVIYHVAHRQEESLRLGEFVDLVLEAFAKEEDFRARRILKPLYADAGSLDLLIQGVMSSGGAVAKQAIQTVAPFARQLYVRKEIQNRNLVEGLRAYRAPDARQLLRRTCEYLIRTRWGRHDRP